MLAVSGVTGLEPGVRSPGPEGARLGPGLNSDLGRPSDDKAPFTLNFTLE